MENYKGKMLDNRYEILDMIGAGGMAVVYKAYCHRLHRFVAIKILRSDFASDSEFRRRFHDEAQAVAMLSHPNIVSVYDISRNDDLDYIVMELIDGITLKQYMKKKGSPLGWKEALHYISQIMRALGHAHSRGIIHRDIKPQNIMVLRDGSVRVADFGIARVMSAAQNTLTQEALGSVHYISPEQARGSNIDERADIYSAGVVLYEMLTGRLPFEGDSPVSVAIQHISSIPLSPRDLNKDIPEALETITLKAMASKVERRYRNAAEMTRDLEEFRKNPNINFDYEHHQDLIMQAVEEPTQIIDTGSFGKRPPQRPAAPVPAQPPKEEYDDYDDDYYDTGTGRVAARGSSKRSLVPIISAVAVFLVVVLLFIWFFFLRDLVGGDDPVRVPSVVGMTLEEVLANPDYTDVFEFVEGNGRPSDDYEVGEIMEQEPKGNSTARPIDGKVVITVTVSSGQAYVTMVDLTNMPHQEALLKIQSLGLTADTSEYKNSDITKGHVVEQIPLEGEMVAPGSVVKLTLSLGPETKQVAMPSVSGLTEDAAKKMLEDLDLVCVINYYDNDADKGKVFYQSISSGQSVEEGSSVTIHVSNGPSQTDPPQDVARNKTVTIIMPTDVENVTVRITVDGTVKFEGTVNTANTPIFTREVDGIGKQTIRVFINGELKDEYEEDFSS